MDYDGALKRLRRTGDGARLSKRRLANNTRLTRGAENEGVLVVTLHSTDIVTLYPSGRVVLNMGGWNTVTTRDRMNQFSPVERVWSESGQAFCQWHGKEYAFERTVTCFPDGTCDGQDATEARAELHAELLKRKRDYSKLPRVKAQVRARYWVRKARGIEITRCSMSRWNCATRRGRDRTPGTKSCGCVVRTVVPKLRKPLTITDILAETNASVRVAKMTLYGVDRFFVDSKPTVLDEKAGYQLVRIRNNDEMWTAQTALKMTCPSTGAVYINTVPPNTHTVSAGLDYMFGVENYLERVGVQT